MYYTYTVNLPSQDPVENARQYVKLPRSILLPPYLAINPYFVEFTDAIDQVFDSPLEAKLTALKNLRNMWATSKTTEEIISSGKMIPVSSWGGPDRSTVIKQVNLLGMKLTDAGLLGETSYRTVSRFLGQYWFEKGKGAMMDFLNFCTDTTFVLISLWTQDYISFYPEGSSAIGTPIWKGGTWYPTTHVQLGVVGVLSQTDLESIGAFFYEIANYNLVLDSISLGYIYNIVNCTLTLPQTPNPKAQILTVGMSSHCAYNIKTSLLPLSLIFITDTFDGSIGLIGSHTANTGQAWLGGTAELADPTTGGKLNGSGSLIADTDFAASLNAVMAAMSNFNFPSNDYYVQLTVNIPTTVEQNTFVGVIMRAQTSSLTDWKGRINVNWWPSSALVNTVDSAPKSGFNHTTYGEGTNNTVVNNLPPVTGIHTLKVVTQGTSCKTYLDGTLMLTQTINVINVVDPAGSVPNPGYCGYMVCQQLYTTPGVGIEILSFEAGAVF